MTREARSEELASLWPAVRSAHLMGTQREFAAFHEAGAWRVRVSDRGDVIVLEAWRDRGDVLAIRALCAPAARIAGLVDQAATIAASRGYRRVMSPLIQEGAAAPYRRCGMGDLEGLVAFTVAAGGVARGRTPRAHPPEAATPTDVEALERIDVECFGAFWRHGPEEFGRMLATDHVRVVRDDAGVAVGYAASTLLGSTVSVSKLAVIPGARRRGVATALLCDADRWALRCGALGISLCTQESNYAGRTAYEAAGFRTDAHRYLLLVRDV
ncbi:MAG: GNAT family N-acetyltransferase [Coriobacteriia bacterium]|nr:GNAT family N-acetyltransferase [Coriobacteriia bacterium]